MFLIRTAPYLFKYLKNMTVDEFSPETCKQQLDNPYHAYRLVRIFIALAMNHHLHLTLID